jgi:DNA-binding NarL/FixJ family response regulator
VVRLGRPGHPRAVGDDAVAVLVVDDQEPFRDAVAAMIGVADGFRLAGVAASGDEGLVRARADDVDLVLLDVNLGVPSGLEVCRLLLADAAPPAILLMSAYRGAELPVALESLGVPFVAKDHLSPGTLAQLWRELGRPRRAERG